MYENLKATVDKALDDSRVTAAKGAMVYMEGNEFRYVPISTEVFEQGGGFIFLEVEGESYHFVAWCREAVRYMDVISGLLNNEITEIDGEQ